MPYTPKLAATVFNVTQETIRLWAKEFSQYLSPTATPEKNRHRIFTDADMQVFSLVAELKKQGMTFTEVHAALKAGQRGNPPVLPPEEVQAIVGRERETQLSFEVERLQRELLTAESALRRAQEQLLEMERIKTENIRLSAQLEMLKQMSGDALKDYQAQLEATVTALTKRIEDISLQVGREYAKGFTEGLREAGTLKKQEE